MSMDSPASSPPSGVRATLPLSNYVPTMRSDSLAGCLLGCALGDSIGLPYEGARPDQVAKMAGPRLRQRFTPFGSGYASDDTDHTRIVLQALLVDPSGGDEYARALAQGLRWWFLSLPVGIGLGTARACFKLLVGMGPERSGVLTAGNGPAMRSAILGVFRSDDAWLRRVVKTTTRITHTDIRAEHGALLVARMAALSSRRPVTAADIRGMLEEGELADAVVPILVGLEAGESAESLIAPEGPSGFVLHTVPAVVAMVVSHPDDFEAAIERTVRLGGDTDTVAAIVGAIVGAGVGLAGLPPAWLEGYRDWPWSADKLLALVAAVDGGAVPRVAPTSVLKSGVMLPLALAHLFRRYLTVFG